MNESIADRYRRRAAAFTETVATVPPDRWGDQSPCPEWTAVDVVRHVVETQGLFAGFVGRELDEGPDVDIDPLGAWVVARDETQAALDAPTLAGQEYDGFMGPSTFEAGVDNFLSFDLIAHRWDLARATGRPEEISPPDVEAMQVLAESMNEQMSEAMRGPGAFGPELSAPEGADAQTRALAFIGRRSW